MVAQLLAHIDAFDAAIANSDRIAAVLTPHEDLIERLCRIPGIHVHAAQVLIAECGLDIDALSDRQALRLISEVICAPSKRNEASVTGRDRRRPPAFAGRHEVAQASAASREDGAAAAITAAR
jgi:hypothetical protein